MKREIIITSDGSTTIHLPEWDEQYHSKYGAIQESYHVFIKNGLELFDSCSKISILEIGLGTGLNCLITFLEARKNNLKIEESRRLANEEIERLKSEGKQQQAERKRMENW